MSKYIFAGILLITMLFLKESFSIPYEIPSDTYQNNRKIIPLPVEEGNETEHIFIDPVEGNRDEFDWDGINNTEHELIYLN